MATKYAIAAGGNCTANGTWSTIAAKDASRVANTTAPTAADDVVLDSYSGNVTINAASVCRSVDASDYSAGKTLTHNAFTLSIGDGTTGAGNKALDFSGGFTYTLTNVTTSAISFVTSQATTQTINFSGKTTGNVSFSPAASRNWQLTGTWLTGATATVTLSRGTLDTNGYDCTWGLFNGSGGNTRSLILGDSIITMIGAGGSNAPWNTSGSTNFTFNAGTSNIIFTNSNANLSSSLLTFYDITFNASASACVLNIPFNIICHNLTKTGGASKTDSITSNGDITANLLTLTGNSAINRLLFRSTNFGSITDLILNSYSINNTDLQDITVQSVTAKTITNISDSGGGTLEIETQTAHGLLAGQRITITGNANYNGNYAISNPDVTHFHITKAYVAGGTAQWLADFTNDGANLIGDCQGNVGINFTTPVDQISTGTASFTWSTHGWTTRVPLPQDNVFIPNSFVSGRTITADMPRLGKNIDFNGCTGNPTFTNGSLAVSIYGSLTFVFDMSSTGGSSITFSGRGNHTINTFGKATSWALYIAAPNGIYTLLSDVENNAGGTSTLANGTLDLNDFDLKCTYFSLTGSNTRSLFLGNGTIELTVNSLNNCWVATSTTNLTFDAEGSTILVSGTSLNQKTFAGGGLTYNNLTITGQNIVISGSNIFNTLAINNAGFSEGLLLVSGTTQTISALTCNGSVGNIAKLLSHKSGMYGGGLNLAGTSDAVSMVDHADFKPSGNFTIMSVIRTSKLTTYMSIFQSFSAASSKYAGIRLVISATNKIQFSSGKNTGSVAGTDYQVNTSTNSVNDGSLKKIICKYDGAKLRVFIDSVEEGTGVAWTNSAVFAATNYPRIGCDCNTGTNASFYNGMLDELAFFPNDALSDAEIVTLQTNELSTQAAILAKCKFYGRFNSDNLLADSSGQNHTMTAIGNPTATTPAIISKPNGKISVDYLEVRDNTGMGGALYYSRPDTMDSGGNTNWFFGTNGNQQIGISRIEKAVARTLSAISRITNRALQTISALANITSQPNKSQSSITRLERVVTRPNYDLDDNFERDLSAGQINGTQAEPTGGVRTVTDTNGKIAISGGKIRFSPGLGGSDGLWYSSYVRQAGKVLLGTILNYDANQIKDFGWDNNQAGSARNCLRFNSTGMLITMQSASSINIGDQYWVSGVPYRVACVMRANGMFFFIKGGVYTNWTLLWINFLGNETPNYPATVAINTAADYELSKIQVPSSLWSPSPMVSDSFDTTVVMKDSGANHFNMTSGRSYCATGPTEKAYFPGKGLAYVSVYSAALAAKINKMEGFCIVRAKVHDANVWVNGITGYLAGVWRIDASNNIRFATLGNGNMRFTMNFGGAGTSYDKLMTGQIGWNSYAMAWSKINNFFRPYLNGDQLGTDYAVTGTVSASPILAECCTFGSADTTSSSLGFIGWIGDVIESFGVQPTNAQVKEIDSKLANGTMSADYLDSIFGATNWAWWKMDEQQKTDGTAHPEANGGGNIPWTGYTWGIIGGQVRNTPAWGLEMATDYGLELWTDANNLTNWTKYISGANTLNRETVSPYAGTYCARIDIDSSNSTGAIAQTINTEIGQWYRQSFMGKSSTTGKSARINSLSASYIFSLTTSWAEYVSTGLANSSTTVLRIESYTGTSSSLSIDNVMMKKLTTKELFGPIWHTLPKDYIADVDVTPGASQAGFGLNIDSKDDPHNFVIAFIDRRGSVTANLYKAKWDGSKIVYTSVISANITYAAGATLRVLKEGNNYTLYYNGGKVGNTTAITDTEIVNNTYQTLFNPDQGNALNNFVLWARGTNGEYNVPDNNNSISATARLENFAQITISALSRITNISFQQIFGVSRLENKGIANQHSIADILNATLRDLINTVRIEVSSFINHFSIARIENKGLKSQTGTARIHHTFRKTVTIGSKNQTTVLKYKSRTTTI